MAIAVERWRMCVGERGGARMTGDLSRRLVGQPPLPRRARGCFARKIQFHLLGRKRELSESPVNIVMQTILSVVLIGFSLTGCDLMSQKVLQVDGYSIPKDHIVTYVSEERGRFYLRLSPPGDEILLIRDQVADRKQNERGGIVVSGINDGISRQIDKIITKVGPVFCKQTPKYACGFQIDDDGNRWSIEFDRKQLPDILRIKARALDIITGYKG